MSSKSCSNFNCNPLYAFGMIGAFVYYFPQAHGFVDFIVIILKSIFWPVFLILKVYAVVGM